MNAMSKSSLVLGRMGMCHSAKLWGTIYALSLHKGGKKKHFLQLLDMTYT